MAIHYSIYQNPPRRDGKEPDRHIQVKNLTPADSYTVAEWMHKDNGIYSVGNNAGTLTLLEQAFQELLAEGHSDPMPPSSMASIVMPSSNGVQRRGLSPLTNKSYAKPSTST